MKRKKVTDAEIIQKIDSSFECLEEMWNEGLERLKLFHAVKNSSLEKERDRLSLKIGIDHPRVIKMAARLKYNQGLFKDLDVEIEKSKIKVPALKPNSWMAHGRVLDKDRKGISGLTVSLYDENGNWIKRLGFGCTDKYGYFSIVYTLKEKAEPEVSESMKLFLYVSDKNYKILYKDSEPLYLKIGLIDYREIYLSDDGICTAPQPGGDDTMIQSDTWVVKGRVSDENGEGFSGLTINLFDKDHHFDDKLKTAVTGKDGSFILSYKMKNLPDLLEAAPDIFLNVLDSEGKTLHTSKKAFKCLASGIEYFDITIKRGGKTKK